MRARRRQSARTRAQAPGSTEQRPQTCSRSTGADVNRLAKAETATRSVIVLILVFLSMKAQTLTSSSGARPLQAVQAAPLQLDWLASTRPGCATTRAAVRSACLPCAWTTPAGPGASARANCGVVGTAAALRQKRHRCFGAAG